MKIAADDATGLVEDTFETAREGAFAIGVKALDAAKTNSDASFALAKDLFGAKTLVRGDRAAVELRPQAVRRVHRAVQGIPGAHREVRHRHHQAGDREGREDLQGTQGRLTADFLLDITTARIASAIRAVFALTGVAEALVPLNRPANDSRFRPPKVQL